MSRPMRALTAQKGYATASHDLCAFGGAAGQHAAAIAKSLGISTVIIPRFSSILSAFGVACADLTAEAAVPFSAVLVDDDFASSTASSTTFNTIESRIANLKAEVVAELKQQDVPESEISFKITISTSYDGSDTILQVPWSRALRADFVAEHLRQTSFSMNRRVVVSGIKVRGIGKSLDIANRDFAEELEAAEKAALSNSSLKINPGSITSAYFEFSEGEGRRVDTPVYALGDIPAGASVDGPALVVDTTQTIVVEPSTRALILEQHVVLQVGSVASTTKAQEEEEELIVDPIQLAVFGNRFMGIAEEVRLLLPHLAFD